jgi:DHA2 family multidrug resistance protein
MPLTGARRAWVLGGALGAIFIDQSASTIATATLPSIQGAFGLGPDQGSWVLTIYNAAYYASILTSIWMIARVGRKRFLVASLLAYAFFSLLCVVAPNATFLLCVRFLQGAAEGGLFTTATLVMLTAHRPDEIPKAFFAFSITSMAGGALGPLVGGSLVEWGYWSDAFAWSALAAAICAAIIIVKLPRDDTHRRIPYDAVGFVLAIAMFVPFQYLINEGERRDWFSDPHVTLAAIAFPILLAAFIVWKRRYASHPFLDLRVLANVNVAVGTTIAGILALAGYSTTILLQYAQADAGFSPTEAGWVIGMRVLMIAVAVPAVGLAVLARWINARVAFMTASALYVAGLAVVALLMTSDSDLKAFVPLTLAVGLFQGIANQPLPGIVLGGLRPDQLPFALVFYKLAPLIGTSLGSAAAQRMVEVDDARRLSDLAGSVTLHDPGIEAFMHGGAVRELGSLVTQQAAVLSYADVTVWVALFGVVVLPLALLLRLPRRT